MTDIPNPQLDRIVVALERIAGQLEHIAQALSESNKGMDQLQQVFNPEP